MSLSGIIEEKISPIVEQMGSEVVEVNYEKGRKQEPPTLWIYIYNENGVDFELLASIQAEIEPILDDMPELGESKYHLNISSPGLDRAFKTERDFARNMGKEVEIKFYAPQNGKKMLKGILKEYKETHITVEIDGEDREIEVKKTSKISQALNF